MRLVTAISMAVVFIVPAAAQSPLPVEKESHHSVVLENAYVRVIDMILQPGEETLDHRHSRDTLQVMVGPSPMRIEVPEKPPVTVPARKPGDVGYVPFSKSPVTHRIKNLGTSTLHILEVELLSPSPAPPQTPFQPEGPTYKQILDNDRVRVFRRMLAPGETSGSHTHHRPYLGVNVAGGDFLFEIPGQPARNAQVKPATISWSPNPITHSITNTGKNGSITLDIELK